MNYAKEEAKKLLVSEGYDIDESFVDDQIYSLQNDELAEIASSGGSNYDPLVMYFADKILIAGATDPLVLKAGARTNFDNTKATDAGAVTGTYSGIIFNDVESVPAEDGSVQIIAYKFKLVA